MRDWAQISELYTEFRDSELRTNTRVKLSANLDAPAGDDLMLASKAEYAKLYKAKLLEEASYDDDD